MPISLALDAICPRLGGWASVPDWRAELSVQANPFVPDPWNIPIPLGPVIAGVQLPSPLPTPGTYPAIVPSFSESGADVNSAGGATSAQDSVERRRSEEIPASSSSINTSSTTRNISKTSTKTTESERDRTARVAADLRRRVLIIPNVGLDSIAPFLADFDAIPPGLDVAACRAIDVARGDRVGTHQRLSSIRHLATLLENPEDYLRSE